MGGGAGGSPGTAGVIVPVPVGPGPASLRPEMTVLEHAAIGTPDATSAQQAKSDLRANVRRERERMLSVLAHYSFWNTATSAHPWPRIFTSSGCPGLIWISRLSP